MSGHRFIDFTEPYRAEAEADMRRLGFDPTLPEAWRRYALLLVKDRQILHGIPNPDDDETIEISKASHERLMRVAGPMVRVIAKLQEVEEQYLKIEKPDQQDVLEHAIALLILLDEALAVFRVSRLGGLPTPLRLVQADLVNVLEGRLGRLVSPADDAVAGTHSVPDSRKDRARLTIQAYAAAAVKHLIASGRITSKEEAYEEVARALERAGFGPPGKETKGYSPNTVRSWHARAESGKAVFDREYREALRVTDMEAKELLLLLQTTVQSLMFRRGPRNEGS